MKKCPPGVICIENFTSLIMCIILFIVGYFVYVSYKQSGKQSGKQSEKRSNNNQSNNQRVVYRTGQSLGNESGVRGTIPNQGSVLPTILNN